MKSNGHSEASSETQGTSDSARTFDVDADQHDALRDLVRLEKMIGRGIWAMAITVFVAGGWMARLEGQTQTILRDLAAQSKQITEQAARGIEAGKWQAATDADRYTAHDHVKYAEHVSELVGNNTIRTTRLEETCSAIKDHLTSIENKLDKIEGRLNRMP